MQEQKASEAKKHLRKSNDEGLPFLVDRVSRRRHSTYFEIPEQVQNLKQIGL
jgi:hypothetical protein